MQFFGAKTRRLSVKGVNVLASMSWVMYPLRGIRIRLTVNIIAPENQFLQLVRARSYH